MTDVPKDAREQLEAFARGHSMMTFGTESVPMWVLDLALAHLDLEAAAKTVTEEMRREVAVQIMHADAGDASPEFIDNCRWIVAKGAGVEHFGDCTNHAITCLRCVTDHYLELADRAVTHVAPALLLAGEMRGLERAAKRIEDKHRSNWGAVHPMAQSDADAIRALIGRPT